MFLRLSRRGRCIGTSAAGGDELVRPVVNENLRGVLSMPDGDSGGDDPVAGLLLKFMPMPGGLRTPAALLSYHQWYLAVPISFGEDILY